MTCVAFSIKFAKTNQTFAENSEFVKKIHYDSKLFTSLLIRDEPAEAPGAAAAAVAREAADPRADEERRDQRPKAAEAVHDLLSITAKFDQICQILKKQRMLGRKF